MNNYDLNKIHSVLSEASAGGVFVWTISKKCNGERAVVIGTRENSKMQFNPNNARNMAGMAVDGINGWLWLVEDFGAVDRLTRMQIRDLIIQAADLAELQAT